MIDQSISEYACYGGLPTEL